MLQSVSSHKFPEFVNRNNPSVNLLILNRVPMSNPPPPRISQQQEDKDWIGLGFDKSCKWGL